MPSFAVIPSRMALINIDVQNCFVESCGPDGLTVVGQVNRLARVCRDAGIVVFHFRHILPAGFDLGVLGEILPALKNGVLHPDAASAAFHPGLVREPGDILMDKPHYGAFHDTRLELHLRRRGVDTVMITGIETNVCCETTAREAMVRDFRVVFLSDGTTTSGLRGVSRTDIQRLSLATLGACFAQVLTVDEMIEKIRNYGGSEMNNKAQLMTALRQEFDRWETALAGLAEAQITAAPDDGGFSIKDTMAHLHAWQQISMARLEAALRESEPDYPAWLGGLDPDAEEHLETINSGVYRTYRDWTWVDVHRVWRDGFRRLLALAEAVPEEDLMETGKYAWLADDPLSAVLAGTLEHHEEHWDALLALPPSSEAELET